MIEAPPRFRARWHELSSELMELLDSPDPTTFNAEMHDHMERVSTCVRELEDWYLDQLSKARLANDRDRMREIILTLQSKREGGDGVGDPD